MIYYRATMEGICNGILENAVEFYALSVQDQHHELDKADRELIYDILMPKTMCDQTYANPRNLKTCHSGVSRNGK